MLLRTAENLFVNKNAIKSKFGNILEKVGISQNGWELFWEFQDFEWEFHSFGSNNTVNKQGIKRMKKRMRLRRRARRFEIGRGAIMFLFLPHSAVL